MHQRARAPVMERAGNLRALFCLQIHPNPMHTPHFELAIATAWLACATADPARPRQADCHSAWLTAGSGRTAPSRSRVGRGLFLLFEALAGSSPSISSRDRRARSAEAGTASCRTTVPTSLRARRCGPAHSIDPSERCLSITARHALARLVHQLRAW